MLGVKITPRTTLYLSMEEDNGINKGGYFVKVFNENDKVFANFVIRRQQLIGSDNPLNLARKLAVMKIKEMWSSKRY